MTINNINPAVFAAIEDALQDERSFKAVSVLNFLCKDTPINIRDPSIGFCLDCAMHKLHTTVDELLANLGQVASSETLFALFTEESATDGDKTLYCTWLLQRFFMLSNAVFLDPKDMALCIWEKGYLKRSNRLTPTMLSDFIKKIHDIWKVNLGFFSTFSQAQLATSSTSRPSYGAYPLANESSSSKNEKTAMTEELVLGSAIPNGNCLFDSVSQLMNDGRNATAMRQLAVNYMRNNPVQFTQYFETNGLQARIKEMEGTLEFADHYEIIALALVLNRQIIVISNGIPMPPAGHTDHPILYLQHDSIDVGSIQVGHYQPLKPKTQANSSNLKWFNFAT